MEPRHRHALLPLLAVMAVIAAAPARATVFERGGPLSVIDTAHFSFIFPEECRDDAAHLAATADDVYAEVTAFVGTDPGIRIPVLVSGDSQLIGGYTSVMPADMIVIYRAPPVLSAELGSLDDPLATVFRHELTHAVSLNVKSGFWAFLEALFGDVIAPNYWWMVGGELIEGVTVAFESTAGSGRANDPLVLLAIRQDILEGKARTPQEARGGDDRWPGGASHYWYGGLFTVWLRDVYGAEKYAALWRELGKGNVLTGSDGFLFLRGAFETVYSLPLNAAWNQFLSSAAYTRPVVTAVRRLREEPGRICAVSSRGSDVYWGDSTAGFLFVRDGETGATRSLARIDSLLTGISVRGDPARILLSEGRYTNSGSSVRVFVREWDAKTARFTGPEYPDLREAAWVGEDGSAFAAVGVRGSFSDLVLVRDGRRETLLEGSYDRQVSSPAPMEDGRIAFLLREKGTTRIARMDPRTRAVEVCECEQPLGVIRDLSARGDALAFSWATREDFPSLGVLDESGLRVQTTALSGGVTRPAATDAGFFYVGRFSDGCRPCQYPGDLPALALEPVGFQWKEYRVAAEAAPTVPPSHPYSLLPSLVPALRFPYPKIGSSGLEGAGVYLLSMDPMETWLFTTAVDWDWTRHFFDVSAELAFMPASSTITLDVSDQAAWDSVASDDLRTTSLGLGGTYTVINTPDLSTLSFSVDASLSAWALASGSANDSAYGWAWTSIETAAGAVAAYDGRVRRSIDPGVRPTGLAASLALDGAVPLESALLACAAAQCELAFSVGSIGLSVDAWAAATLPDAAGLAPLCLYPAGIYREGAVRSGVTTRYPVFREYQSVAPSVSDSWLYGFFDVNWMPLEADVMRDARNLKLFITRMGASVGYRGALAGMAYLDAAYVRLHVQGGMDQGAYSASLLGVYGEISCALRAAEAGVADISIGFGIGTGL